MEGIVSGIGGSYYAPVDDNENENEEEEVYRQVYKYGEDISEVEDKEYTFEFEEPCSSVPEEGTKDWEREAKKTVMIEIDEAPANRRMTIYELPSYDTSAGPSTHDILKLGTRDPESEAQPKRRFRYSTSLGVSGIARINMSPLTQKIVGCVIGEDITTEFPWVYVRKETIEDNMDLHSESSDFLPIQNEINAYPEEKMLIGYAPSTPTDGQFYICLTKAGRDAITEHIQKRRREHEDRVRTAVYKPVSRKWEDLGSGQEVDEAIVKNKRPLIELEVIVPGDTLNKPMNLVDRQADDQRDGYVELLPYRQAFKTVQRRRISRGDQITAAVQDNEAQTTRSMMVDNWFQYRYEYTPIDVSRYNEEQMNNFKDFLQRKTETMCEEVLMNATWDIYANDYANLVRDVRDTEPPVPIRYTEQQNYHDSRFVAEKVINDVCWHPLWSGIAIAGYTYYAKSEHIIGRKTYDEVKKSSEGNNIVLVWSFTDCLSPKLILECPREVTAVSVCPLDGNVIIGGCANGQIAIWDITGRLEQVETVLVQTPAQMKYHVTMKNLMSWMQDPADPSVVRPVAMTSIQNSQKKVITRIIWVPPHQKVTKNGRIESLPEDGKFEALNWQFVTSSEDGTIAFWDLKWTPAEKTQREETRKRKRKMSRPEALEQSISRYKILDGVLTPDYILTLQYPDMHRPPVITTLSMYSPRFRKELVRPKTFNRDDITVRRHYSPVIEKPNYTMEPRILVGTVEGDIGCVTWEGYEFSTGVLVNRESCQWQWIKSIHDGPVTHAVRSKYHSNVVLTVGGKIFAVWRDDQSEPIFWKKSIFRYTACAWGTFRPTVLILTRVDGNVEIWDLVVKTHEPSFTQSLSGRIITGIYPHELDPQCLGFCDFNGTLRIFTAPSALRTFNVADIQWMRNFVDRQVDRMNEFKEWQRSWLENNVHVIEERKKLAELDVEKEYLENVGERKRQTHTAIAGTIQSVTESKLRKGAEFLEEAKARWLSIETNHMQRVILEKKGLRKDVLERQRAPVLKLRQDAERKKRKIRKIFQLQDEIFQESVAYLFPAQHDERKLPPSPLPPLREKRRSDDELVAPADVSFQETWNEDARGIICDFLKVQTEALASLKARSFEHSFNWRKLLTESLSTRQPMDSALKRRNSQKGKQSRFVDFTNDAVFQPHGEAF